MYLLLLLIPLFFGILLSFAIDRRVEETLPPYIFLFLIFLFGLAILKKPHHAFELSFLYFIATWMIYIIRKKRIFPTFSSIREALSFGAAPGFWCYMAVVLVMMYFYSNHFVNNWDDYHFNATFARNMFLYGGMPTGWKAATSYKTYKPFMQMFYNWGFQGFGQYKDALMFQYKSFLIYTGMLPVFDLIRRVDNRLGKVTVFVLTLILPYCFMYELVDSLSMDGMMGILFGISMVTVIMTEERDYFFYLKTMIYLASLVLVKSTGIIFAMVVLGTWFMVNLTESYDSIKNREKGSLKWLWTMIVCSIPMGIGWLAWKIFCDRNGNTTFLNNILDSHLESEKGLPWYGPSTIVNGIKQLFTLSMNLGVIGLTFVMVLIIAVIMAIILYKKAALDKKIRVSLCCILLCVIPYVAVLLYTYIFVFFDYEAIELASYDRYLGTYALGLMIFMISVMYKYGTGDTRWMGMAITLILTVTLNFPYLYNGLMPFNYLDARADIHSQYEAARVEGEAIPRPDGDTAAIIMVGSSSESLYSRALEYFALPLVSSNVGLDGYSADTDHDGYGDIDGSVFADRFDGRSAFDGGAVEDIISRMNNGYDGYVYFNNDLTGSDSARVFDVLLQDGHIEPGVLYRCDKGALLTPVN